MLFVQRAATMLRPRPDVFRPVLHRGELHDDDDDEPARLHGRLRVGLPCDRNVGEDQRWLLAELSVRAAKRELYVRMQQDDDAVLRDDDDAMPAEMQRPVPIRLRRRLDFPWRRVPELLSAGRQPMCLHAANRGESYAVRARVYAVLHLLGNHDDDDDFSAMHGYLLLGLDTWISACARLDLPCE
jgi:hypothetical protein